jgi:hypothetical protein
MLKAILLSFMATLVLFGDATFAENMPGLIEMLALYPDQDAVYLRIGDSTAVSYINQKYHYSRYFHSAAMALRKGGGGTASAASPVLAETDDIKINAFTITSEGETLLVGQNEIAKLELFGNKKRYVVTFPDTRAGSIFIFEWKLESNEPVFSGRRYLGRTYPVLANRTVISCPEGWVFNFLVSPSCIYRQQRSPEYIYGNDIWVNHIWNAGSLPGIVFEENSPPITEFIPCLNYAFSYDRRWPAGEKNKVDWQLISSIYQKHLNSLNKIDQSLSLEAANVTAGASSAKDKARRIFDFVTKSFSVVYSDIDISAAPDILLKRGAGSQAEGAFILGAMFSKSDITFNYVLISTRDNGEVIKSMPALYYFNRLLVAARFDRDTVWFDPAYRGVPMGILPFEDQAVDGLPIKNKADGFITTPISDYRENGRAVNLKISFDSKGALVAECLELLSGSLNVEEKNILQSLTPDESRQRWVDLTSRGLPGSIMKDLIFSDINSDIDPFRVSYRLELPDFIKSEDTRLFIPLDILGRWQFDIAYSENRRLPIELGRPHCEQEQIQIDIPTGFRVEYLPDNFNLNSYLGEIFSVVVVTANTIMVTRGLSLKPYRLKAESARSLNGFFSTARDEASKFIILRK